MDQWFYKQQSKELGPLSAGEIRYLARTGHILPATLVRQDGTEEWMRFDASDMAIKSIGISSGPNPSTQTLPQRSNKLTDRPGTEYDGGADHPARTHTLPPKNPPIPLQRAPQPDSTMITRAVAIASLLAVLILLIILLLPREQFGAGGAAAGTEGRDGTSNSINSDGDSTVSPTADLTAGTESDVNLAVMSPSSGEAHDAGNSTSESGATEHDPAAASSSPADQNAPDTETEESSVSKDGGSVDINSENTATDSTASLSVGIPADGQSRFAITAPGEVTFFGIRASGNKFIFVVDCSGSMSGRRLERAKQELMASLQSLPASVQFNIIFFDDNLYPLLPTGTRSMYKRATRRELQQVGSWIQNLRSGGGTDVRQGMLAALSQSPSTDVIFLLTDGEFEPSTPYEVKTHNKQNVRVNTIAFESTAGESLLQQIARDSGGDYRFVP